MDDFYTITGGKWWKVDFHLHTPGSHDYGHGDQTQLSTTPEDYLKCCMRAELDCIVIADHNTCEWALKLRTALKKMENERDEEFRDICIFPGIELNVQGNVHLLGIFDPEIDEKTLMAMPLLVGYDVTLDTTTKSLNDVIDIITSNNGIAIPAHVDGPSGLLYEGMKPTIIKAALGTGKLLALEVIGDNFEHHALREAKVNLSYVVGSDSHSTDTIGDKYTWVKMGSPNIEAMRLALFDTEDGVIRYKEISGNPNDRHGKTYIRSVEIINGKYIGRKEKYRIEFSPWLNSLIGGRGSGKSAVLNFIRLILGREDELPEKLQQDYYDFVKVPSSRSDLGMLQKKNDNNPGTIVMLEICVDGVSHTLKWEDGNVTEFNADTNEWDVAQALKERFPVRMFSQKQLFEMTGDTGLLFNYLDSKWDYNAWKNELVSLQREYSNVSRELHILIEKQRRLEQLNVQLTDVNKKIGVFETEKTRNVLQRKEHLKKQRKSIEGVYESYAEFISWANEFSKYQDLGVLPIEEEIDVETIEVIKKWCNDVVGVVSSIKEVLIGKEQLLVLRDAWIKSLPIEKQIEANLLELEEVIEELRDAGVDDVDRYTELITEKERVEKEINNLGNVTQEITDCNALIDKLRDKWSELVKKRYKSRNMVLSQWNQIGALKLSLIPFGDVSSNENEFRQIIRRDNSSVFNKEILEYDEDGGLTKKGILYFLTKETDLENKLNDLGRMKHEILTASSTLGKRFSEHLSKLFINYPDSIAELEMWVPKDALKLEINVSKKGRPLYRSIDAGSPGQRTSAILSLILGISTIPIIIDQPEDDLDTRNITDIVVSSINEIKKHQQIILVTHNPNIVVNTNSEQVVQLDFKNGQIINACSGALQNHNVRDAICEVMEGGKEALEKRYYRIFKALE